MMGRKESIWGADAAAFDPERWLTGGPLPSPFKFPAFQAGPRVCLGQTMAYLEVCWFADTLLGVCCLV